MHLLPPFLRSLHVLPSLSFPIRLGIFIFSLLFCGFFMVLGLIVTNNRGLTPIFAIPVALAAWMFQSRQAALAIGGLFLTLILINTVAVGSLLWPLPLTIAFLCGMLAALVVAISIGFLRYALRLAEIAYQHSQQAEWQMTKAYKQEQHLNDMKDQFLLDISHELRTPLSALYGYLQLLQEHQGHLDVSLQTTFLTHAMRGSEELIYQVDTILDAVQCERAEAMLHIEELSVVSMVQSAVSLLEPQYSQSHTLDVRIPENLIVRADRHFFYQIIWNLLSNAFKYSPPQTTVIVGARQKEIPSWHPQPSSFICIWVLDMGPGITPEEVPLLFRKFVRLKRDLASSIRGTGLGLYICKQLVEAMGGYIWIESADTEEQGSCFCFTLPLVSSAPALLL